jgi:DNA polymerase sigma
MPITQCAHRKLSAELLRYYKLKRPTETDVACRNELMVNLQLLLQRVWPGCTLRIYGSSACGFASHDSDVDLDIVLPPYVAAQYDEPTMTLARRNVLRTLDSVLARSKKWTSNAVLNARVPILKVVHRSTGVHLDIACLAKKNDFASMLLADYARTHECVIPLVFAIKRWSKCRGIRNPWCLNSFAFTLMLVQYLQCCDPPVLPNFQDREQREAFMLQKQRERASSNESTSHVASIATAEDSDAVAVAAAASSSLSPSSSPVLASSSSPVPVSVPASSSQAIVSETDAETDQKMPTYHVLRCAKDITMDHLGDLLIGFFSFYTDPSKFDPETSVVSIRVGRPVLQQDELVDQLFGKNQAPALCIEDPFALYNNVAQNVWQSMLTPIMSEIERARDMLKAGATFDQVCVPSNDQCGRTK